MDRLSLSDYCSFFGLGKPAEFTMPSFNFPLSLFQISSTTLLLPFLFVLASCGTTDNATSMFPLINTPKDSSFLVEYYQENNTILFYGMTPPIHNKASYEQLIRSLNLAARKQDVELSDDAYLINIDLHAIPSAVVNKHKAEKFFQAEPQLGKSIRQPFPAPSKNPGEAKKSYDLRLYKRINNALRSYILSSNDRQTVIFLNAGSENCDASSVIITQYRMHYLDIMPQQAYKKLFDECGLTNNRAENIMAIEDYCENIHGENCAIEP